MSADRFPDATWAPLSESGEHGRHVKTQLIFHSTGTRASAAANRRYFNQAGVKVESTLIVNYDGGALQVMEAYERADANTSASRRAISVEVVGEAHEPFTPAQLATCIAIARWACAEHPIERRQAPVHDASGIGWHVMFGAPGPWTNVSGKSCPGSKRIAQVRDVIIPAVQRGPAHSREDLSIVDQQTKDYFDEKFAKVSGGPRVRDRDGKVVDNDPSVLSEADTYTLVEESERRTLAAMAASEARIIAAVKGQS
jgi:hypothetical protein